METASPSLKRWPCALLIVLVLAVWGQSLSFEFVWDDQYFIQELKSIRSLASVPEMFYRLDAQSSFPEGFVLFRPLRTLHYAILFAVGGGGAPKPWLFHLTNLAWHTAAVLLLYQVLILLFCHDAEDEEKSRTGRLVALLAAAAFAVHPAASEVICWAKSLDDLMAATFVLGSTYALLRWQPNEESRRGYLWAIVCFALAVYSKESAIPFALFCIPFLAWRTKKSLREIVRLSAPFLTIAFLFVIHRHFVIGRTSQTAPLSGSYGQTLIDTLPAGAIYGRLLAGIPPFCIDYDYMTAGHSFTSASVLMGGFLVLVLLSLSALTARRATMLVGTGALWLLLFMLPYSNLIPMMQYCAERFLYLPMLGFILALGSAVMLVQQRRIALVIGTAVVLVWGASAWNRSWIWRDPVTLFVTSHLDGPTSPRVQDNAIAAVMSLPHVRAVFLPVKKPGARVDLIVPPLDPGRPVNWPAIEKTMQELRTLFPENATVSAAFAITKALQGKEAEALPFFEMATMQRPNDFGLWNNLARACAAVGQFERAEEACQHAVSLAPESIATLQQLADVQWRRAKYAEARMTYVKLCALDATNPEYARRVEEAGLKMALVSTKPE